MNVISFSKVINIYVRTTIGSFEIQKLMRPHQSKSIQVHVGPKDHATLPIGLDPNHCCMWGFPMIFHGMFGAG